MDGMLHLLPITFYSAGSGIIGARISTFGSTLELHLRLNSLSNQHDPFKRFIVKPTPNPLVFLQEKKAPSEQNSRRKASMCEGRNQKWMCCNKDKQLDSRIYHPR